MAYDFSPAGVIREAGFVSPSPSENFTDDGNFFSVYYYHGDPRLPFTRWTKGMQGGISTPDQEGELLGFDGLSGRHSYSETKALLDTMREDYPDLARDYEKYEWTGSLGMSQARTREGFLDYMKECALLGRRLQRYLDGKDPYGKDESEIAEEHLKDLWTAIRDQGARTTELNGYEFQLSKKDHNVAWFTGTGRGNWFTITYDPANKTVNVSKKRLGSTDIAEADEVEITARAVVDAVTEMIDSKGLGGSQKGVDDDKSTAKTDTATDSDNEVVESDDGFIVEVVESGGRLRVQGDDGVHGTAWVRFPNNLRTKAGRKYKVDQLKWNGKNYTIGGYINFVEDNGSLTKVGEVKLTEDAEDQWNKEALDIDKENTERVLAGITGEDVLEEKKEDKKTMSNGIDIDRIMNQLKKLEGKKQLRDVAVTGPAVTQVSEPERVERDHTNKTVKLTEDTEDIPDSAAEFSLPYTEALSILQMLSPEQVEKLVIQFNLEDEDQENILDILTDFVTDSELEKIRENPEGYLAIKADGEEGKGEESLEEDAKDRYQLREYNGPEGPWGVYDTKERKFVQAGSKKVMAGAVNDLNKKKGLKEEKSLRDIILLTEDNEDPQTVDEWLDKIEKQSADIAALMDEILAEFRKNTEEIESIKKSVLGEDHSKDEECRVKLTEAVKKFKTRMKKLLEDTEVDPEAVLADSDAELEVDNDVDIVSTEDKVILDMTTEEGKQEALEVLANLIPEEGITVEITNDDGSVETVELEKEEVTGDGTAETVSEDGEEKPAESEEPPEDLEECVEGTGNKVGSIDMTEDAEDTPKSLKDLAAETKLEIDDKGKVTSGQAVKTIKAKVAKFNKANKTDFKVNYEPETDSIVIS